MVGFLSLRVPITERVIEDGHESRYSRNIAIPGLYLLFGTKTLFTNKVQGLRVINEKILHADYMCVTLKVNSSKLRTGSRKATLCVIDERSVGTK